MSRLSASTGSRRESPKFFRFRFIIMKNAIIIIILAIVSDLLEYGYGRSSKCGWERFQCKNGQCIANELLCDGRADCKDQSDETVTECNNTDITCADYEFRCSYGGCIDGNKTCNGIGDCVDNSDETLSRCKDRGTTGFTTCSPNQFLCDNRQCIPGSSLCDGTADCADSSDETPVQCESIMCPDLLFRCNYGGCIDGKLKCNRAADCVDGSDEDPRLCGDITVTAAPDTASVTYNVWTLNSKQPCRTPPHPRNGFWKLHKKHCASEEHCDVPQGVEVRPGTSLVYDCNPGYKIRGYANVVCGLGRVWLYIPICTEIRCRALRSASTNAVCSYDDVDVSCQFSVLPRTVAVLSCSPSYSQDTALLSRSTVKCNKTGQWDPEPIQCIPTTSTTRTPSRSQPCYAPPQPKNGFWKLHKSQCASGEHCDVPEGFQMEPGTYLVYYCDPGYKIRGSADVVCGLGRVWLNIPACTVEIRCRALRSASTNAVCSYDDEDVSCQSPVLPRTVAVLSCRPSYSQDTALLSRSTVKCNKTGQWDPEPIQCIPTTSTTRTPSRSQPCIAPRQPEHGFWKLNKLHCASEEQCDVSEGDQVAPGTSLIYDCHPGYNFKGCANVVCGVGGTWFDVPDCTEIRCRALESASTDATCWHDKKYVSCQTPVLPGTMAKLMCHTSYREDWAVSSISTVTCNKTGQWEPEPIRCIPECGRVRAPILPLIVNGNKPNINEFPWHATLYKAEKSGDTKKFICGATIIGKRLLVTAAHCVFNEVTKRLEDPSKFFIATGNIFMHYDYISPDPHVQKAEVKNMYVNCEYNGLDGNYAADIAILEIKEPFVFSTLLMPICMDVSNDQIILEAGVTGKVAGFGRTAVGEYSSILQSITVPYIPSDKCRSETKYRETKKLITRDKFCAGYRNGTAVCDGDSGGGLAFSSGDFWYLIGIVSASLDTTKTGAGLICDSNTYSLYTRVSEHMFWIKEVIHELKSYGSYRSCGTT